jgi:hypothetical protein
MGLVYITSASWAFFGKMVGVPANVTLAVTIFEIAGFVFVADKPDMGIMWLSFVVLGLSEPILLWASASIIAIWAIVAGNANIPAERQIFQASLDRSSLTHFGEASPDEVNPEDDIRVYSGVFLVKGCLNFITEYAWQLAEELLRELWSCPHAS